MRTLGGGVDAVRPGERGGAGKKPAKNAGLLTPQSLVRLSAQPGARPPPRCTLGPIALTLRAIALDAAPTRAPTRASGCAPPRAASSAGMRPIAALGRGIRPVIRLVARSCRRRGRFARRWCGRRPPVSRTGRPAFAASDAANAPQRAPRCSFRSSFTFSSPSPAAWAPLRCVGLRAADAQRPRVIPDATPAGRTAQVVARRNVVADAELRKHERVASKRHDRARRELGMVRPPAEIPGQEWRVCVCVESGVSLLPDGPSAACSARDCTKAGRSGRFRTASFASASASGTAAWAQSTWAGGGGDACVSAGLQRERVDWGGGALTHCIRHAPPQVAIKTLLGSWLEDQRTVERFREEIALMSTLQHPNVLQFIGAVVDDPSRFWCEPRAPTEDRGSIPGAPSRGAGVCMAHRADVCFPRKLPARPPGVSHSSP